jgi:hypothetical protein
MRNKWTRESIIRHLLEREAQGLPVKVGGNGVGMSLYQAAKRNFGSWRNALQAAGITPQRVPAWERWSPARILVMIRNLARRDRPLTTQQMERRYHNLVSAARRHFGSWNKAALAAGVEPSRLQRVATWSPERVIETILTRALRNESLVARLIEPRSLVAAGQRFFGGWPEAVAAAGLDPVVTVLPPRRNKQVGPRRTRASCRKPIVTRPKPWNRERVIAAMLARLQEKKPMNSYAIECEDYSLFRAIRRYLKNWHEAMRAAGLDPALYRLCPAPQPEDPGSHDSVAPQSQADEPLRPDRPA